MKWYLWSAALIIIFIIGVGVSGLLTDMVSEQVQSQPQLQVSPSSILLTADVHKHQTWDSLLNQYVTEAGLVNYSALLKDARLDRYLLLLQQNPVQDSWSRSQKLAYWINVYNAFTVKLIIDNYPVESIRDIQRPWGRKFIQLGDQTYSLNQIEHDIIRPVFNEPRIHFAVVCAAVSCPKLLNQAYLPEILDQQLESQTRHFINESGKNEISHGQLKLSQLFNWYNRDFIKHGSLVDFLNKHTDQVISQRARLEFLKYDWSLNDALTINN